MLPTHAKRMQQEQWEKEGKTSTVFDRDFRPLNDEQFPSKPNSPTKQLPSPAASGFGGGYGNGGGGYGFGDMGNKSGPTSPNSANLNAWPLTPQNETVGSDAGRSVNGDRTSPSRPGTSGGYKITPTIPSPPPMQSTSSPLFPPPHTSPHTSPQHTSPHPSPMVQGHNATPRVPELSEKEDAGSKKKGGCGCCVVM